MTFTRSRDFDLITLIMADPAIYGATIDDYAPAREDFRAREDSGIWYCLAHDGRELLGLFAIAPQNTICWEVHTRLLRCCWGARARLLALEFIPWVFTHTVCERLVTSVPASNPLAIRFAKRGGMTEYGRNPASFKRDGKLHDQVLLGVSKPAKEI